MKFARNLMSCVSLSVMSCGIAHAQSNAPQMKASQGDVIEDIVVTGQKIDRDLQKSPISITAISAGALDRNNIVAAKDLDATVIGLVINSTPSNPLALSIRGAGYQGIENPSAQPGVSYNQNGVYISSPISLNANFLDVDQIEVLRGPQGTVLGQNSDGGAINVNTTKPQLGVFKGNAEVSLGSFDYDRARLVVNVPLGDKLAIRGAFQQLKHDGYSVATGVVGQPNYQLGNENSYNGRVDLLWKPTDRLSLEVWGELYHNSAHGDAFKNIYDPNTNPYVLTQDYAATQRASSKIAAANLSYDLGWSTARFIGSYQKASQDAPLANDHLDLANALRIYGVHDFESIYHLDSRSFTQELDFVSKPGGRFDWIVGAFLLEQDYHETLLEQQTKTAGATLFDTVASPGAIFGSGTLAFVSVNTERTFAASLYGQGTYHFSDKARLTLGARGTSSRLKGLVSVFFNPAVELNANYKAVTGKAEFEYDLAPRSTIYAMWSSGIKPGGVNLNPGSAVISSVFKPERNNALEVGSKNEFFDRKLRLNVATFYNFFTNYQVGSEDPIPFDGGQTNISNVRTYGIEGELTALLPLNFRLDGGLSVAGGQVKSAEQLLDPVLGQAIDKANGGVFAGNDIANRFTAFNAPGSSVLGKTPPQLPGVSLNVNLSHKTTFGDGSVLNAGIRYSYRQAYWFRIFNNPATDRVPTLQQYNLSVDYKLGSLPLDIEFDVINLLNKASVNSRFADYFAVGAVANHYVPPRQFIGRVRYSF